MDALQLSPTEQSYYLQLFTLADLEGTGVVGGLNAFNFFSQSGVDRGVLRQVWEIADSNQTGSIGPDGFSMAMRLIAQAQAGATVSPEMVQFQPPSLATFQGIPPPPTDAAAFGGTSNLGGGNFNGGGTFNDLSSGAGARGRSLSRERGGDSATPTPRDMRKYARLFQKHDQDMDGKVTAQEAQELFSRSGMDMQNLANIWELSDVDHDGFLCWPEFVLAMHLIRRCRAQVPLPLNGLPVELTQFLGNVDSPQNLAMQHGSRSRSVSPGATSAGDASWSPVRTDMVPNAGFGTSDAFDAMPGSNGFGMSGPPSGLGQQGVDAPYFGTQPHGSPTHQDAWADPGQTAGFGHDAPQESHHSSKKGHKHHHRDRHHGRHDDDQHHGHHDRHHGPQEDNQFPDFGKPSSPTSPDGGFGDFSKPSSTRRDRRRPADLGDDGFDHAHGNDRFHDGGAHGRADDGFSRNLSDPDHRRHDHGRHGHDGSHSPDFGHRNKPRLPQPARHDAQPVEHLEVLIEADKVLVQGLRHDVDELDEELTRMDEACRFEEREAARERGEIDRVSQERQHLTQQLAASQRQLSELKVEHEGIVLENVMLRCDHDHFAKEAVFLRRLVEEGTRDSQALQQSIEYLEQSNSSLRSHTATLEEARREVLETVKVEKELLRKEQMEAEFAKKALEALRTDGVDGLMRMSAARPTANGRPAPMLPPDVVQRRSMDSPGFGGAAGGIQSNFSSQPAKPFQSQGQGIPDSRAFNSAPAARDGLSGNRPQGGQRSMNLQREREGV